MSYISVTASSTTLTPTGRASDAPSPSAPPPSGSSPWVHLCHNRTTSWTTPPRPVVHLLQRSYSSPKKASCTLSTRRLFFSSTDHSRTQCAMPAMHHSRPLTHPSRLCSNVLMRPWVLHTCHSTTSCPLGVYRILSMLRRFHWWIGNDSSTHWWLHRYFKCQARKTWR